MNPYRRLLGVVVFFVALLAVFQFTGLRDNFSLAFLRDAFLAHKLGGVLIFVAMFSLGNLIQIPGWIFLAAAVLALGRVWGGVVTYIAAVMSCAITFLIIRLVGGDALLQLKSKWARKILGRLHAQPVTSIALLRTMFQTLPALNAALALSGVKFRQYLAGTMLGLPLPIALYCLFFDYLAVLLHLH
ncbi:VTT domain-containing protein [Polaromonas sp. C04]|uniref:VTT domain-containing protein n=1 Tax=Polaromonas sp. C04 TaxID=1945857 RepID=UPI000984C067|nr:VTT domain-containing protein [Polaromonas sp. C04]OOG56165.1 DedA family protein [Polaromonas sp. C04]